MPVIQFTTADVLRAKTLEEGYYSFLISGVLGPATDKSGSGVNYKFQHTLIDVSPEMDGKVIDINFSSKAISMMIPCIEAANGGGKVAKEGFSFNTDDVIGKKVDAKVVVEIYNGQPKNDISAWFPYKGVVGKGPAF